MELVGNQHESEQLPAEPADRQSKSIDEALVVPLVVEDPPARIAPAHDMIDGARELDSQRLARALSLTARERCVDRKPELTPANFPPEDHFLALFRKVLAERGR